MKKSEKLPVFDIGKDRITESLQKISANPQFTEKYMNSLMNNLEQIKVVSLEISKTITNNSNSLKIQKIPPINPTFKVNSFLVQTITEHCKFLGRNHQTEEGGEVLLHPKVKRKNEEDDNSEEFEFSTYNTTGFPIMRLPTLVSRPPMVSFCPFSLPQIPSVPVSGIPRDPIRITLNIKPVLPQTKSDIENKSHNSNFSEINTLAIKMLDPPDPLTIDLSIGYTMPIPTPIQYLSFNIKRKAAPLLKPLPFSSREILKDVPVLRTPLTQEQFKL